MNKKTYSIEDIKSLKYPENVQMRPQMYIGTTDNDGVLTCIREIINNSVDEHLAGFCNTITVTINHKDFSFCVTDDGRGVPFELDGKYKDKPVMATIFGELHAGRNFVKKEVFSTGINGVGSSCVNALSEHFSVSSFREGRQATITFERGIQKHYSVTKARSKGTEVRAVLCPEFFEKDSYIDTEKLVVMLNGIKLNCPTLTINLDVIGKDKSESFNTEIEYNPVDVIKTKGSICDVVFEKQKEGDNEIQVAFSYDKESQKSIITSYCNTIETSEGGSHVTGFKRALSQQLLAYINEHKLTKEKITSDDVYQGLNALVAVFSLEPKYSSQTKQKITNNEIMGNVVSYMNSKLQDWFTIYPEQVKLIAERISLNAKFRIAQKKAIENVKKDNTTNFIASGIVAKLSDCQSTDPEETELFIVEGDSANGTVGVARDKRYQAVYRLRGKPLNVENLDVTTARKNKEIDDLFQILKCGTGNNFDISKLKYGKIIFLSDADVDGCLHGDTRLLSSLGKTDTMRNIYKKKSGDVRTTAYSRDKTYVETTAHDVRSTKLVDKLTTVTFKDGSKVRCTYDHLFLLYNENYTYYKSAIDLREGDKVRYKNYGYLEVSSIKEEKLTEAMWVYDATVDKHHNFMLENGVIVHNSHIQMLLLTMFGKYFEPLIEAGRVYIGIPPLYRITQAKKDPIYLANDIQLQKFIAKEISSSIKAEGIKLEKALDLLDEYFDNISFICNKYFISHKDCEWLLDQLKLADEAEDTDELDVEFSDDMNYFSASKFVSNGDEEIFININNVSIEILEEFNEELILLYRLFKDGCLLDKKTNNSIYSVTNSVYEIKDYIKSNLLKSFSILRMKGLGESNAEDLEVTTMNPESRTLIKITLEDLDKPTDEIIRNYMGNNPVNN